MGGISASAASSTTSGSLGTGIDVTSTVSSLMQFERLPETQLQNQQTQFNTQLTALRTINSNLSSLQSAVQTLTTFNGQLNSQVATSSNTNLVTASADGTAATGNHQVVINNLATTSSFYTNAVKTSSTPLATGSFTIAVGSNAAVGITVDSSNNTLAGLAQTIN